MHNIRCRGVALALAVVLSAVLSLPLSAATFTSSCDLYEADGNTFGPPGGAPDFVDHFDNGTLAPDWVVLLGSAQEAGTDVTMHNPGFTVQLGNTDFEISTIEHEAEIEDGVGDFTGTSHWSSGLPGTDSEFHMQFYAISPVIEAAGLSVNNFSPQVAAQQGGGPAGYSISQSLTQGFGPSFTTLQSDSVPISASSVTGQIVLRMALDDATNIVTSSFSLDGGATFQSPFPPLHVFNDGVQDYEMLLGAAALTPNAPPPPPGDQMLPLRLLALKNPTNPSARGLTYKAQSFPQTFNSIAGDPRIAGASLNVQIDSQNRCFFMSSVAWTLTNGYTYRDPHGMFGPVKSARIKQTPNGGIMNKVTIAGRNGPITIVPPNPGNSAATNFYVPGGGSYCTTTAGGTINPNNAKKFKARNPAAAPPYCLVPACSPSGAFLDQDF